MPVIEQAKGILMAQYRCRPDEAFDILRREHARMFAARERAQAAIYRSHPDGMPADGKKPR